MLIKPPVPRDQLVTLIPQLRACLIGREAKSAAHHCPRVLQQHRHTSSSWRPNLTPYCMSRERDKKPAADTAAICDAATRPSMRFLPLKSEHQQATLCLHRTPQGFAEERNAIYDRL